MRILRRVRGKFEPALIKLSVFLRWPWLTARILLAGAGRIGAGARHTVLVTRRSIFVDDLRAMARFSGRVNYVIIRREGLQNILAYFLGRRVWQDLTEENYHNFVAGSEGKTKYRRYLQKLLPLLQRWLGFEAVMSANMGYIEQQELEQVCRESKIPFIVLLKEGITTPGAEAVWAGKYRPLRFVGTKLLVYNERIKRALLAGSVPHLTATQVKVVGVPRIDELLCSNSTKSPKKQMVFFSFYPEFLLDRFIDDPQKLAVAKDRCRSFHVWVMRFAQNHPDVRVIIKTKVARFFLKFVRDIFARNFQKPIKNLLITDRGNSTQLIVESQAVIAFNSTTLIEAVAADRIVMIPDFGDLAAPGRQWDHFGDEYGSLVRYVKKPEDLDKYFYEVRAAANGAIKSRFLEDYVFNTDGQASVRAEQEIIKMIN